MNPLSGFSLVVIVVSILWVGLNPDFAPPPWLGNKLQHVLAFVVVTIFAVLTWPRANPWTLLAGIGERWATLNYRAKFCC
ncbi:hypothetical protein CHH26_13020 [Qipengyuania flava]|nr:hypothetical protein CHH26_13020 [Qipengyuania flava]